MKRIALGLGLAVVAAVALGLVLMFARPDFRPAWAQSLLRPAAQVTGLYCQEHGVPEQFCTLCHAELTSKLLLCPEHGNIPEDICTKCHPEVEKLHNIQMCPNGHGLPAYFCIECAALAPSADAATPVAPDDGWCASHGMPEELCVACLMNPELPRDENAHARECLQPLPLVRLATPTLGQEIGLDIARAEAEVHAHTLEANAETDFDANHYADINPRVTGFLQDVKADLGQRVTAGEVLAIVDSPTVSALKSRHISAQAALELAKVSYERTKSLAEQDALPAKQELEALTALNQAESDALEATQELRNLGFLDHELESLATSKQTSSLLPILSPIDGTVVQRHAVRGEAVQATTQLFAVADTSKMWLWIDAYEGDMERVAVGQPVRFSVSGAESRVYEGDITWEGAQVDTTTRTTRIRAELDNTQGKLRANQFGQARILVGQPHQVVVVPKTAVQTKDNTQVVFLPQGKGVYRPQRIVSKPSNSLEFVEVAWGLRPGDEVVTNGSFWLKTEIMKGAIGAGCCE